MRSVAVWLSDRVDVLRYALSLLKRDVFSESIENQRQNVSPSKLQQKVRGAARPAGCKKIPEAELPEADAEAEVTAGLRGQGGGGRGAGEDGQPHRGPGGQAATEAARRLTQGERGPVSRGHQGGRGEHDGS